jgi:hypothetical protein
MEKVIPSFQYEPLFLIPKLETSYEEEEKGNTNGVGPSGIRTEKEEPSNLRGGRDSSQREVGGMKCVLKKTLKPLEFVS